MRKGLTYFTLLWLAAVAGSTVCFGEEMLGDVTDGSRAVAVHLIPLLAEAEQDGEGEHIYPDDEPLLPFSTRQTCGACHSYETISAGRHFNAVDPTIPAGRTGHPWILAEPAAATQIPLSYRKWPQTFNPDRLGITPAKFVQLFGRHMPGGGVGEMLEQNDDPDESLRAYVTGPLEINCLACHDGHYGYYQADFASEILRGNYRWAATSASEFGSVTGSTTKLGNMYDFRVPEVFDDPLIRPPAVTYRQGTFDDKEMVLFDIASKIPNQRCYFCHSGIDATEEHPEKWRDDEDVHLGAGLTCVDCHRNGLEHNMTRGYEWETSDNPLAAVSSCKGCHLGNDSELPVAGRFAAPVPDHPGIPPVHFDKLLCTACHSGSWPKETTIRTKTAMAHAMGTLGSNKSVDMVPHIVYPVFAKNAQGKIGPHKLIWPAFWGEMKGSTVEPIDFDIVSSVTAQVISKQDVPRSGDWAKLTDEQVTKGLSLFASQVTDGGQTVYITGGKVYKLEDGKLTSAEHESAGAYLWPIAHNVRPAAQSLGVRRCEDCHSTDSGFFFGLVPIDSPLESARAAVKEMVEFQGLKRGLTWFFAFSFVFRPWLKVVTLLSSLVILGVVVLYALRALGFVARVFVGKD